MTINYGRHHRQLNSYHQTKSLLFQFVLSEFLQTFAVLIEIDKLTNLIAPPLDLIEEHLHQLVGASHSFMQLHSWKHDGGFLSKLESYADVLFTRWATEDEQACLSLLHQCIHKSRHAALECLDSLLTQDRQKQFSIWLEKLRKSSQLLKKALEKAIPCFKEDENVIFFILRHHSQLSAIYGSDFVPKAMKKMFPGGLKAAQTFLQKAYLLRNFEHLAPVIKTYFTHLKGHV